MTHNIQTSFLKSTRLYGKRRYAGNYYTVIINTEEGQSHSYDVEADSFAEATEQAEEMANSLMEDITYIEVYDNTYFSTIDFDPYDR